jgi:hypothetical protein
MSFEQLGWKEAHRDVASSQDWELLKEWHTKWHLHIRVGKQKKRSELMQDIHLNVVDLQLLGFFLDMDCLEAPSLDSTLPSSVRTLLRSSVVILLDKLALSLRIDSAACATMLLCFSNFAISSITFIHSSSVCSSAVSSCRFVPP